MTDPEADDLADDPNRRFLRGSMWQGRARGKASLIGASLSDPAAGRRTVGDPGGSKLEQPAPADTPVDPRCARCGRPATTNLDTRPLCADCNDQPAPEDP